MVTYPQGQEGQIFVPSAVCTQERNHELRHSSDLRGDALSLVQSSDKVIHQYCKTITTNSAAEDVSPNNISLLTSAPRCSVHT